MVYKKRCWYDVLLRIARNIDLSSLFFHSGSTRDSYRPNSKIVTQGGVVLESRAHVQSSLQIAWSSCHRTLCRKPTKIWAENFGLWFMNLWSFDVFIVWYVVCVDSVPFVSEERPYLQMLTAPRCLFYGRCFWSKKFFSRIQHYGISWSPNYTVTGFVNL